MTIRVFLGASTTMVRSALQAALDDCDDIELVELGRGDPSPASVDVVVLQKRLVGELPASLRAFAEASRVQVVAINDDGHTGDLYRIYRSGWQFAPGRGSGLADAIRAVAGAS